MIRKVGACAFLYHNSAKHSARERRRQNLPGTLDYSRRTNNPHAVTALLKSRDLAIPQLDLEDRSEESD